MSTQSPPPPGPGLVGGLIVGLMTAKAVASGGRQAAARDQPSRRPCADGAADRRAGLPLSAAARLGRPHADRAGARGRRLSALGDDHRRCARRGLRQDGQDARPALSGRAERREGGEGRRSRALRLPAPDEGLGSTGFLLRRAEDGGQAGGDGCRAAVGQGRRRHLRLVPGGGVGCAGRSRRPEPGALPSRVSRHRRAGAGRGGRRRGQPADPRRTRSAVPGARLPLHRAAARTLHRQCGDDRLGRHRAHPRRASAGTTTPSRFVPRSRWPLDEVSAPVVGSGRRGAKA